MNLQIQHIAKKFHNGTKALADVDFSVSQGEFVSVIGPSGNKKVMKLGRKRPGTAGVSDG